MTNIPGVMTSKCLLLRNMFDPEELVSSLFPRHVYWLPCTYRETERDWDKELAADVKEECEGKYGPVEALKIEVESQVSILSLTSP